MATLIRPRPYISWSQLELIEKSEQGYLDLYLHDEKRPINRGMATGKKMADALESGEATGDPEMDLVIARLPKFELMDKEMRMMLKGAKGQETIEILIKPDTAKIDLTAFKEYKTGQEKWTKKKVDTWGQITFYAMGMYLKTGKIPSDIELVHAETAKDSDGRLYYTGEVYRHRTVRTMGDIINMMVRTRKAWNKIGEVYTNAIA